MKTSAGYRGAGLWHHVMHHLGLNHHGLYPTTVLLCQFYIPVLVLLVTVSLGKTNPEENTCEQDKVLLKDLTAQDMGFCSPDHPVV